MNGKVEPSSPNDGHIYSFPNHLTVEESIMDSVLLKQGCVSGALLVSRDIRERKKAEEKIASLLDFQNKLLDTAAIWINTVDLDGNIFYWNRAAEEISGYARDEVLGNPRIWEWLYPDASYRNRIQDKGREGILRQERFANQEARINWSYGR